MSPVPHSFKQWVLRHPPTGIESLVLSTGFLPPTLGEYDVLVQFKAVSLNYRDIVVARVSLL